MIKFRGQRIDNGEWIFGNYIDFGNFKCIWHRDSDFYDLVQRDRKISPEYMVDPKTVGQYLGIKDMAGNEVFEGDILKTESHSKIRITNGKDFPQYSSKTIEILFKDGNFKERVIAHENSYFGKIPSKPVDVTSWIITKAFKIIGNIHDTSKTQ
jgi:uncharacterized phage protein (TIGR01671 family)